MILFVDDAWWLPCLFCIRNSLSHGSVKIQLFHMLALQVKWEVWGDNICITIGTTKLLAPSGWISCIIQNMCNGPFKSGPFLLRINFPHLRFSPVDPRLIAINSRPTPARYRATCRQCLLSDLLLNQCLTTNYQPIMLQWLTIGHNHAHDFS